MRWRHLLKSNGWVYFHDIHLPGRDWLRTLDALLAAVDTAREVSSRWAPREIHEKASGTGTGDKYTVFTRIENAVADARSDPEAFHSVRWDLSQGRTDSPGEPEYMRIRSYQLTASRGSGLTLYASSPDETEVTQLLAAVRLAAEEALGHDVRTSSDSHSQARETLPTVAASHPATDSPKHAHRRWPRLRMLNAVLSHPVLSPIIVALILAAIAWLGVRL
jgi:hypothetical protein